MNFITKARTHLSTVIMPEPSKFGDRGAGFVEYTAIILIVAAIAVALYGLGLQTDISGTIGDRVDEVLQGPGGSGGGDGGGSEGGGE